MINESRQSQGSFSELVMEEYDKMKLNPLVGTRNDIRLDSNSPSKQRGSAVKSEHGHLLDSSPQSDRDNRNDLVYPYKPPTEAN